MKKNILGAAVLIIMAAACNPTTQTSSTENDTANAPLTTPVIKIESPVCFAQQTAGDTFTLQLKISDSTGVEGLLTYGFKEKDSNKGTIAGMMYGDTLIADYHFMSEGKTSVREVAFLIAGNTATEGYADMEDKNGKLVFKDAHAITFGKGIVMNKVACSN